MSDILTRLENDELAILVEMDEKEVFRSRKPGVAPLLELVDRFPDRLEGAHVADRVVGGCAARVFAWLRVKQVYALTSSVTARAILDARSIGFEFRRQVRQIRNRSGTDICPFEALGQHHHDAEDLITAMRRRLTEMRAAKPKQSPNA